MATTLVEEISGKLTKALISFFSFSNVWAEICWLFACGMECENQALESVGICCDQLFDIEA